MPILEAHKGVCTECPENTMSAFRTAVREGYKMIELDPNFTSDGQLVVLHDNIINRTARYPDGSEIEEPVDIQSITLQEALKYDFGIRYSEEYRGEKLPLLEDVFSFAEESGIPLKIDNKFEKFPEHIKEKLFDMIRASGAEVGLTVSSADIARMAVEKIPDIPIHYDGLVDEETLKALTAVTGKLTVWVPFECRRTSWVKVPFASHSLCDLIRKYALLGIWIISDEDDYAAACSEFDPDLVETDGTIKPGK